MPTEHDSHVYEAACDEPGCDWEYRMKGRGRYDTPVRDRVEEAALDHEELYGHETTVEVREADDAE